MFHLCIIYVCYRLLCRVIPPCPSGFRNATRARPRSRSRTVPRRPACGFCSRIPAFMPPSRASPAPGTSGRLVLLLALCLGLLCAPARPAVVIANSQLQTCTADGSAGGQVTGCKEKLTATVAVESGETLATTSLQVQVQCVNPDKGSCPCQCQYGVNGCTCRDLKDWLTVEISKDPIKVQYPLTYNKSYPSRMFEVFKLTGTGTGGGRFCDDSPTSSSPTCGWAHDAQGHNIPDSQGFCCTCSLSQGLSESIGIGPGTQKRGDVSCGLLQNALWLGGVPGSAHCLVWDQKMYNGYYIGQSTLDFTVHVNVKTDGSAPTPTPGPQASSSSSPGPAAGSATPASPNASPGATLPPPMTPASTAAVRRRMLLGGTSTTTASATPAAGSTPAAGPSSTPGNPANATTLLWDLSVSPSASITASPDGTFIVKLLGDLSGYTDLPVLSEKLLLIPAPQAAGSQGTGGNPVVQMMTTGMWDWILADQNMVSVDGTECNKIGTSFAAFRDQPDRCGVPLGTCLSNQPADVYHADQVRLAKSQVPLYRLHKY